MRAAHSLAGFLAVSAISALLVWPRDVRAKGVEDVFKGQVIIVGKRPPSRFASQAAWVRFLQANRKRDIWPEKNNKKEWRVEFMAFFAKPLNDVEVTVKFYDVTEGKKFVAADNFYMSGRGQRVLASSTVLDKPRFTVNRKYVMTVTSAKQNTTLAAANFWLRGEREHYSGRVTFSDDDTRVKDDE